MSLCVTLLSSQRAFTHYALDRLVSYFQKIRGDEEGEICDEKDGRACAELVCDEFIARKDKLKSVVATCMFEYTMLRTMMRPDIMQEVRRGEKQVK